MEGGGRLTQEGGTRRLNREGGGRLTQEGVQGG